MVPHLPLLLVACVPLLLARGAAADCRSGMDALSGRVGAIADDHLKAVVEADLRRAGRELNEGDEDECEEALQHARSLLKDQHR